MFWTKKIASWLILVSIKCTLICSLCCLKKATFLNIGREHQCQLLNLLRCLFSHWAKTWIVNMYHPFLESNNNQSPVIVRNVVDGDVHFICRVPVCSNRDTISIYNFGQWSFFTGYKRHTCHVFLGTQIILGRWVIPRICDVNIIFKDTICCYVSVLVVVLKLGFLLKVIKYHIKMLPR